MKITIVRKKASSLRELGRETVEIPMVSTLDELLTAVAFSEFEKQHQERKLQNLSGEEIRQQAKLGRVSFNRPYNETEGDSKKAMETMRQDFTDGLFRVFINEQEYTSLDEKIHLQENDELTFIRLVMLAGRLW